MQFWKILLNRININSVISCQHNRCILLAAELRSNIFSSCVSYRPDFLDYIQGRLQAWATQLVMHTEHRKSQKGCRQNVVHDFMDKWRKDEFFYIIARHTMKITSDAFHSKLHYLFRIRSKQRKQEVGY